MKLIKRIFTDLCSAFSAPLREMFHCSIVPLFIFFYLVFNINYSYSQFRPHLSNRELIEFRKIEKEMIIIGDSLLNSRVDSVRKNSAYTMINKMVKILKLPKSYLFNFDSIKTISILRAPDDSFKVFTWYWINNKGKYRHFGIFQRNNLYKLEVYPLFDDSDFQQDPECVVTGAKGWYGAIYYQIIKKTTLEERTRYILLGFDGNNFYSNKKVIDVIKFQGDTIVLGGPFFNYYGELKNRVIFEYKKDAVMSVKYNEYDDMIVFDHLAPVLKNLNNDDLILLEGDMLVPDGTYDGLKFEEGFLNTYQNIKPKYYKE